jgi:ketosteroid isomerase-like protein
VNAARKPADVVRSYYRALNTGDADLVAAHFTEDATHYYTRLGPHEGRRAIAENAAWAVEHIGGQWHLDHLVASDEEAAIEWSMTWKAPETGERRINRGAELFSFRDGLICEVRAYHHGGSKNPRGELLGFDATARGYKRL